MPPVATAALNGAVAVVAVGISVVVTAIVVVVVFDVSECAAAIAANAS
jgi:hypothetical protein